MQPNTASTTTPREHTEQARVRALVRFNGMTFHGLAAASFLETAVPRQVTRLAQAYSGRPDLRAWLEQVWWPQRAELGRELRSYIEATWPEFQWGDAYEEFSEAYRPRSGIEGRGGDTLETLALCVTAAQSALFYRALGGSADDPALRALARRAAAQHAGHFDYLRPVFEQCRRRNRLGFAAAWRAIGATCRALRDGAVASAFVPIAGNWKGPAIVPELSYREFRQRMGGVVQRYCGLGWLERMLFRPWLENERMATTVPSGRAGAWTRATPLAA